MRALLVMLLSAVCSLSLAGCNFWVDDTEPDTTIIQPDSPDTTIVNPPADSPDIIVNEAPPPAEPDVDIHVNPPAGG